jgi:hypothetical protein
MKPDLALKALATLQEDLNDSNPLTRALALRTISYIHVRQFVEATVGPLKKLLKDSDPYVRKTAAFTVAKLYDHDRTMVEASDLIDRLNLMLRDENPTVVSSALAALMDIWERSETIKLTIDYTSASKIVQILPDCSEYVEFLLSADGIKEADISQMGPNVHPRSTNIIRTSRHLRSSFPRRAHHSPAFTHKQCGCADLHTSGAIPHELH